jgi:hypothetical protein
MGRIRSIKPEFPQSETTGKLSRDARLLFIQLWTIVDDEGRARAASRMLASLLYPYDDDARDLMGGWLAELERENVIRLYVAEGSTYLEIVNWLKHQKIDHPSKSRLPAFQESSRGLASDPRSLAPDLGPRTKDQDLGKSNSAVADATCATDWPADYREIFWEAYPRKVGKKGALRELDRHRKSVSFEKLISAVRAYTATADPQFTKHPKTWLTNGCWDDEPDTRKPNAGQTAPNRLATALDKLKQHVGEGDRGEEGGDPPPRLLSFG